MLNFGNAKNLGHKKYLLDRLDIFWCQCISRCPMSKWSRTCKQIGGLVNVDMDFCLNQDFGCNAFKKGYCFLTKKNIMEGNITAENCQVIESLQI